MFRDLALILYSVTLALVLGATSAIRATDALPFFGDLTLGAWSAHPNVGGDGRDPYTTAWLARTGSLPLAAAEGLEFGASVDNAGRSLDAACTYEIAGGSPPARLWTVRVMRGDVPFTIEAPGITTGTNSRSVLRRDDGYFEIRISPYPQPVNWIYAGPDGPFSVSFRLYDTAIASDTGLAKVDMPSIVRIGCADG
jgi:hypothetical protein